MALAALALPHHGIQPDSLRLQPLELPHRVLADGADVFVVEHDALAFVAVSDLARNQNWAISELHLEAGRLDEVFRTITADEEAVA